ncbi:nucleotide exchange factor GrpE [Phenylobacterium montanum]|uniref:Protein GrpE n=1 Tax=Phenylobacterium montanum TaxID=2823693 RepID=A0A975IT39_9CAUL|nr:nucleotide exchange factor GrpE [Caulobacter sp. S6]QUD86462.1 nucleotide exchange factor GrpE [Caulobacter sp. S6]
MTDDAAPAADQDETKTAGQDPAPQTAEEVEAALRAEIAQLKDQMLRIAAEGENVRRRAEKEANDARAYAIQKFARDLLGVADNLARAMQHAPRDAEDPLVKNLAIGLEMTEKELLAAFERNGLKRVDPAKGAKFDPHQHQAVMEQPSSEVAGGGVVQVMQVGYELFGRIVRPAMVVVAAKGSGPAEPAPNVEAAVNNPYAHPEAGEDGAGAAVDRKA